MSDDNKSKKLSLKRNNKTGNGQSKPSRSYGGDDVEVKVREKRSFTKVSTISVRPLDSNKKESNNPTDISFQEVADDDIPF